MFDDPISSLNSDILFIVGSLIKGLFNEIRDGTGHIRQVFVLTHNVYFHKEVCYNFRRGTDALHEETFWTVRKPEAVSKLVKCQTNPVKISYEMLWAEVRDSERSSMAIQNTLRRILENYLKILGGVNLDQLFMLFDGKEKMMCQSLCSWVNDGSHSVLDDLHVSMDESTIESYLKVFRLIFERSKHSAHYEMMMGAWGIKILQLLEVLP